MSSRPGAFPRSPAPVEIEIELTNRCNASCVACPRTDMPAHGRMSRDTFTRILDGYDATRPAHPLNQRAGRLAFPRVSLAGGGDPMLHPDAVGLIAYAAGRGYDVHLITNGAAVTAERADALVASGVTSISCSFWGIREEEYEAAMRLPYAKTLERVEYLAERARAAGIPFSVSWVRVPQVTSTVEEIAAFWAARGVEVDTGDNFMWNRGGLNPLPLDPAHDHEVVLPDPARRIWCADLYLSDTWTWDGRCLLCCCNYFTSRPTTLVETPEQLGELPGRKLEILESGEPPAMCQGCRQPRAMQAAWLAEPWRPFVSDDEWDMVTYGPAGRAE